MAGFCHVYVGCETGLIKGVNVEKPTWANLPEYTTTDKSREICFLSWQDAVQNQMLVGHRDRTVSVYNTEEGERVESFQCEGGEGVIKGVAPYDGKVVTCVESGLVRVWHRDRDTYQAQTELEAGKDIFRMRQNPDIPATIATGGKENDLKIWDLEQPAAPIFTAKNVRHDWLNLRVPVWVTDMAFVPGGQKVVTCTGHHQVRLYDPSTPQRRPVLDMKFDEYPITCLSLRRGEQQAVVGNTHGNMALIDLRNKGHVVQLYKGFAGGIRSVQCHSERPLVASCGIDRFLRVHDLDTKALLHKMYLKSRLTCLLLRDQWTAEEQPHTQTDKQSDVRDGVVMDTPLDPVADELWDAMATVETKKLKRNASAGSLDLKLSSVHKLAKTDSLAKTGHAATTKASNRHKKGRKKEGGPTG